MKTSKQFSILQVLIIIIIAYSVMPIVARIFSMYFTTYAYLFVMIAVFSIIIIVKGQNFVQQTFAVLVPLLVMQIIVYVITKPSPVMWVYTLILDVVPLILGCYILKFESVINKKIFFYALLLAVGITAVTTIIGLQIYPNAARYLATVADPYEEENVRYNLMNIGGYEFTYMVTLLYPAIIYGYKRKRIHFAILISYAVLSFLLIVDSGYTISLLLFIISSIFVFFKRDIKVIEIVFVLIVALIFIYVLFPLFSELLLGLSKIIDNNTISERLEALSGGREGLANSDDDRWGLYMISVNSIIKSPIFGGLFVGYSSSGHSFILDFVAQYGLLGAISLYLIYRAVYTRFFAPYKKEKAYGYVFWCFLQTIILSTINTGMWLTILTLFLPIIFEFINDKGEEHENIVDSKRLTKQV